MTCSLRSEPTVRSPGVSLSEASRLEVFKAIIKSGIDPAKVYTGCGLALSAHLRAPTALERAVILSWSTPVVGASSAFAPIFKGWNVWAIWQVADLPFSLLMLGLSRDRQLQIFVEDKIRLEAPEARVADPLDFKGAQIQILQGEPPGLKEAARKEQVPGPPMLLETQDQAPQLRFIRFFNRGDASQLPWVYDGVDQAYLLDRVYQPDPTNEATKGEGPGTITDRNVVVPVVESGKTVLSTALVVGLIGLLGYGAFMSLGRRKVGI